VAETLVGCSGTAAIVTADDTFETEPLPTLFVAATVVNAMLPSSIVTQIMNENKNCFILFYF
jgi:hypothetical protein